MSVCWSVLNFLIFENLSVCPHFSNFSQRDFLRLLVLGFPMQKKGWDFFLLCLETIVAVTYSTKGSNDFTRYRSIQSGYRQLSPCLSRVSRSMPSALEQWQTGFDMLLAEWLQSGPQSHKYCVLSWLTSRRRIPSWHVCLYSQTGLYWSKLPCHWLNISAESVYSPSLRRIVLSIQSE